MEHGFAHLHVHSEYSLLDGGNPIKKLVNRCKDLGMDSVALTDHGNMYGAVAFYSAAQAAGVKPILGIEAYIAPGSRFDKDARGMSEASYHLVLLAENNTGYQNLLKLSTAAYLEGFYYRPRIDREILKEHNEGIICLSACLSGEIPKLLDQGNVEQAEEAARWYLDVFGPERFYIEIQHHCDDQNRINPLLVELAEKVGVQLVATNDVHWLNADDYEAHEALTCISTGKLLDDPNRMEYPRGLYLKSPTEMWEMFPDWPQACANTLKIAERCHVELDFDTQHAPVYIPPEGKTAEQYLEDLCLAGVEEKFGEMTPEIKERLYRELEVIRGKGFSSYFLIVWDFMNYARRTGIPCGTRGSGVGTLVGYVLDISNVDPLAYGLLFERFMDPERSEMPDIDVDICQDGRQAVIDYVRQKYGHVAQITTFGTMKARAVVRDVCRVLNVPLDEADKLAKLIPDELKITLEDALEKEPKLKDWYEKDGRIRKVIEIGMRLEGMARHASVHAAGVVVADEPLDNFLPLYKASDSEDLITQFDGPTVEKVGLLKMDFLGLRTLTIIERARQLVRAKKGLDIDPRKIDLTDQEVLHLFAEGRTKAVFQFESGGMRDLLQSMRPDRVEDLIAANALYRPGPMSLIPDYNARKHGQAWSLPHPIMEEILQETYGIMVYQEQVMQILNRLGDIPLARAYKLIKAISKKKLKVIAAEKGNFIEGCVEKGVAKKMAVDIFDLIEKFGGYGFNKSHSTQYAILAFQTAFFKHYYPTEFMAATLTFEMASLDKLAEYIDETKQMQIEVLPPDLNQSSADFTVIYDGSATKKETEEDPDTEVKSEKQGHSARAPHGEFIRFGLAAVKGVGRSAVDEIIRARTEDGPFENIYDVCQRIDLRTVNKGALEALIKAGAFDSMGGHRGQTMAALEDAISAGNQMQRDKSQGQMTFFGDFESDEDVKADASSLPDVEPWPQPQLLQFEKDVLGMYVTDHPLSEHAMKIHHYSTAHTHTLSEHAPDSEIVIGGMITRVKALMTKRGRSAGARMAMITLEDLNGTVDGVVFADAFAQYEHLIEADRMIFMRGSLDFKREEPCVRVNAIYDLLTADEELTSAICVKFEDETHSQNVIREFKSLCERHRGRCPIYVEVNTTDHMRVVLQATGGVRPSADFCHRLTTLIGQDHFRLLRVQDQLTVAAS